MSPGEAHRLTLELLDDPSSRVAVAAAGWSYPITREGLLLADLWDLLWQSHQRRGRFQPHPRPFKDQNTKRLGRTALAPERVRALLAKVGPRRGGES